MENKETSQELSRRGLIKGMTGMCAFTAMMAANTEVAMASGRYSELERFMSGVKDDFRQFYDKGDQKAGTRLRKAMQELSRLSDEIYKEVGDQLGQPDNRKKKSKKSNNGGDPRMNY